MRFDQVVDEKIAFLMDPIVLAFIGDAVYSLYVRKKAALTSDFKSGKLSSIAGKTVSAKEQAKFIDEYSSLFTEKEADVFRRARNAKKPSRAKHSTVSEYNKSTGLEAVFGYLYITGNAERLNYLLNLSE